MKIKLSDYIMEQAISDASASDIIIEQAQAEMEVSAALCEAYIKEIDSFYYTEQQLYPKRSPSGIGESIHRLKIMIGNFLRRVITNLNARLSRKRLTKIIKKLDDMSDSAKSTFVGYLPFKSKEHIGAWIDQITDIADTFESMDLMTTAALVEDNRYDDYRRKFENNLNTIKSNKLLITNRKKAYSYTFEEYKSLITELFDSYEDAKSRLDKKLKSYKENDYNKIRNNGEYFGIVAKNVYKDIRELYRVSTTYLNMFLTMVMDGIKDSEKVARSSDGEVFKGSTDGGVLARFDKMVAEWDAKIKPLYNEMKINGRMVSDETYDEYVEACKEAGVKPKPYPLYTSILASYDKAMKDVVYDRKQIKQSQEAGEDDNYPEHLLKLMKSRLNDIYNIFLKLKESHDAIMEYLKKKHYSKRDKPREQEESSIKNKDELKTTPAFKEYCELNTEYLKILAHLYEKAGIMFNAREFLNVYRGRPKYYKDEYDFIELIEKCPGPENIDDEHVLKEAIKSIKESIEIGKRLCKKYK